MRPAEISVIIVNYGTADLAIAAVESVRARHHGGRAVDIHVVDNASPGDDAAVLAAAHRDRGWGDRVTLYPEAVNHGFGRGNNLVLEALATRETPPDKVFLLNPDAALATEALAELADFLDAHPRAAIAGCGIDRPDGGPAVSAAFRFPNAVAEFTGALRLGFVEQPLRRWTVALPLDTPPGQVDWVSGAAFMARLAALREVGFFRPDFFLYFEEIDLMRRLALAGWQVHHMPRARVRHIAAAATGIKGGTPARRPLPAYWYDSWRIYFSANHGRAYAGLCGLLKLAGWSLNYPLRRLQGRAPDSPANFLRDFTRHALLPALTAPRPAAQPAVRPRDGGGEHG